MPTYRFTDQATGESWLADRPSPPDEQQFNDLISSGQAKLERAANLQGPMAGPEPTPTPGKGLTRQVLEDITRPQSIGATLGAVAAAPIGLPAGALGIGAAGVGGAALGGAAGELYDQSPALQMLGAAAGGDPSGLIAKPSGPGVSASTPMDMLKSGTTEAANQALAEAGISVLKFARPAVKAGAKEAWDALSPFMPRVNPGWRPFAYIFGAKEPPLIAGQATQAGFWSAMRNIAEFSMFNGGTGRQKMGQEQALGHLTDQVAKTLGGSLKTEAEIGQLLALSNREEFDARNLVTSPIYNYIAAEAEGLGQGGTRRLFGGFMQDAKDAAATGSRFTDHPTLKGDAPIFNKTYRDLLRNDVRQYVTDTDAAARSMSNVPAAPGGSLVPAPRLQVDVRAIKAMAARPSERLAQTGSAAPGISGATMWDKVRDWPDTIDWTAADEFRKEIGSMVRSKALVPEGAPARGVQKQIDKTLNDNMRSALVRIGRSDLVDAMDLARGITRQTQEEFNPKFLNKLLRAAQPTMGVDAMGREVVAGMDMPTNIYNATFSRGNADAIRMIRRSVDKSTYESALSQWMGNTIKDATDPATGNIVGKQLDQLLQDRYSPDFLDAAFGGGYGHALDALRKLSRVATFTQASGSGFSKLAIQLRQGGMMVQIPKAVLGAVSQVGSAGAAYGAGGGMLGPATVFIGPALLGRMLTNPKLAKLIVLGASKPEAAAGRAVASVLARAAVDMSRDRSMQEAGEEAKMHQLYGPALQAPDVGLPLQAPVSRSPHAAPPSPR